MRDGNGGGVVWEGRGVLMLVAGVRSCTQLLQLVHGKRAVCIACLGDGKGKRGGGRALPASEYGVEQTAGGSQHLKHVTGVVADAALTHDWEGVGLPQEMYATCGT